jgi:ATP-dependent DNA helicase RecQ
LLKVSESVRIPARLRFLYPYPDVYEFKLDHPTFDGIINALLRTYPGIFDHYINLNTQQLALFMGCPEPDVARQLSELHKAGVVDYIPLRNKPGITLRCDYQLPVVLNESLINSIKERRREALDAVLEFVATRGCRLQYLRRYFGELDAAPCGHCDNCRRAHQGAPSKSVDPERVIALVQSGPMSIVSLMAHFGFTDAVAFRHELRSLLDSGTVVINEEGNLAWESGSSLR